MTPEHKTLAKLFSVEYLFLALGLMFTLGVGYQTLAATDQENANATKGVERQVVALQAKQEAIGDDIQDVKVDVSAIKANQENQAEQIQQLRQGVAEILRELRQR